MRRAARVDRNQAEIVAALRKAGASVTSLAGVADGCPDLLVGHRNRTLLMEVKDGQKSASRRVLTADQERWHREWCGGPVAIVQDVEGALRMLGALE